MIKLCFSSLFIVLYQAKIGINQETLFEKMIGPMFESKYDLILDKGTIGGYKTGKQLKKDIIKKGQTFNVETLCKAYSEDLINSFDNTKKPNIVLAIKDILIKDTSIANNVIIGKDVSYTKKKIIDSSTFSLPALLSNLVLYVLNVLNEDQSENITKTYISTFNDKIDTIFLNDTPIIINSDLNSTANIKLFEKTFEEVESSLIKNNAHPSFIKIYTLRFHNHYFEFQSISNFVKKNLANYVFSRATRKKYEIDDNIESLLHDAYNSLKKANPTMSLGNYYSEIMLYSFLECALHAPKLFSKIELKKLCGTYESESSGIHLLLSNDSTQINNELIFGSSNLKNDIYGAIDDAFQQIQSIKNNESNEIKLVSDNILDISFEPDMIPFLKKVIIPEEISTPTPDTAFGVFISYNICLDSDKDLTTFEFAQKIKEKMSTDIKHATQYILNKIENLQIQHNSFYIYVLPLIDVHNDKNTIMEKALEE